MTDILYKQQMEYDCMLACISTATQQPYDALWPEDFKARINEAKGVYGSTVDEAFKIAGLNRNEDYWLVHIPDLMTVNRCIQRILLGRRAILQVPSLNNENGQHAIYWAGSEIHDPSNKQIYRWMSQSILPAAVWIFNERK